MALTVISRQVVSLAGATAAAQAIGLVSLPIITRLYPPEDFGVFAAALSFANILSMVACLRYEQAIPLSSSRAGSVALFYLSLILAFLTMSITYPLLYAVSYLSDRVSTVIPYPFLTTFSAFLLALTNILIMWATRLRRIKIIAIGRIVQALSDSSFKIFAGFMLLTGASLLGAYSLGVLLGLSCYIILFFLSGSFPVFERRNLKRRLYIGLIRNRRFFQTGLAETLCTSIAMQAPVILIAGFFGAQQAALLFVAQQIMRSPITLISNAIGKVFLSDLARAQRDKSVSELIRDHISIQSKIGLPLIIILGVGGSAVAEMAFGPKYSGLGVFLIWMVPWMAMVMLVAPFSTVLYSSGAFRSALLLSMIGLLLRVGSVFISYALSIEPIILLSIASIVTYALYALEISRCAKLRSRVWVRSLSIGAPYVAIALCLAVGIRFVEDFWF